ncbi:hypothetical protein [Nocardia bhagyanarayanae]|uniref:Uncharacterized protein n=1 Tax=Nocardia bhagyanarayanae TaxID=1215925 RepID=A0A543FFU2_9NOCA|nr:hypothetical protein [Nocardia bhagyanarayanae]TQM32733.1 hypothetical protein FB390_4429 [Nocardia bhagyanarayanae]
MPRPRQHARGGMNQQAIDRANRLRERTRDRRQRSREREKLIAAAAKEYVDAVQAIAAAEASRDREIAQLRAQIEGVQARAAEEIGRHRANQAAAGALIRQHEPDDNAIAELLETTPRALRQLVAIADRGRKRESQEPSISAADDLTDAEEHHH